MDQSHPILRLLSEASRLLAIEAGREARAQKLSRAQWAILDLLAESPGLTQREIAARLDVEPITVARMLDRLSARDVLERRPDPRDRRVWRIHLSDEGARLHDLSALRRAALEREITAGLSGDTARALKNGLRRAVEVLAETGSGLKEVA